jgi:ABC-type phosphate/phosphonate transport system substrate-binding protein
MNDLNPVPGYSVTPSRRQLLTMMGIAPWMQSKLSAADTAPVRLSISETLVSDVNLNDARAAMLIWIRRMMSEMHLAVEINPRVFDSTEEILRRVRSADLDSVALNVLEYRQIADLLDRKEIIAEGVAKGPEQYVLLSKRSGGIQSLGDLRGRKLCMLKSPKMCVAGAWLTTILDEGRLGQIEQFFSAINTDSKPSRVVLPVFFGQADACLTTKRSFDTMCELNPQVAKELTMVANSAPMVVAFYIFRRNYHSESREKFIKAYADVPHSVDGRQLATLFQFEQLVAKDISCLAPALSVIEAAERARSRRSTGGRKG